MGAETSFVQVVNHLDGLGFSVNGDLLLEFSQPHILNGVTDEIRIFLLSRVTQVPVFNIGLVFRFRPLS